jgi:TonB family protein
LQSNFADEWLIFSYERSFSPFLPLFGRHCEPRAAMNLDAHWRRFFAALLLSCLLHASIVLAPYLGATVGASRPAVRGVNDARRASTLNATLVREHEPAAQLAENSVAGTSPADLPAQPMANADPQPAPAPTLGIDVLPIPAPAYYTSDQLTRRPQPVAPPKLELPPQLTSSFASGKVILKLWINELGAVTSVDIEQSDVPEAVSAIAAATFAKMRFVPGELNGRPVSALMRIEVTYDDLKPPP